MPHDDARLPVPDPAPARGDGRAAFSRAAIQAAFLELSSAQDMQTISISQLCKAAGVSRPTFYQHYADVDAVYAAIVRERLGVEGARFQRRITEAPDVDELTAILGLLQDSREEIAAVLDPGRALPRSRAVAMGWLQDRVSIAIMGVPADELSAEDRPRVVFAVGGLAAVFEDQFRGEGARTDAAVLAREVRDAMHAVLPDERRRGGAE